ncbi:hypothetical protein I4U23_021855 [Adineta vaga]|nr:hypothetical protein I4U23_021855 [Adineta vaga]
MDHLLTLQPDYIVGIAILCLIVISIIFAIIICCIAKYRRNPTRIHLLPIVSPFTSSTSHERALPNFVRQICQVCYNEKFPYDFGSPLTADCRHTRQTICTTCVFDYVQKAFEETCRDDVRCPELDCNIQLDYEIVKDILRRSADKRLFDRYERFIFHQQLEQMNDFIWCSNPACGMGQLNDGGEGNNIVTCFYCHQKTCFIHKVKWHNGLTCPEYDMITNANDEASRLWIIQNSKKCPNCPFQIEKNDGCDHMICVKCHYEFCWSCLADYQRIRQDGNHRHHPNCKHYAPYDEE